METKHLTIKYKNIPLHLNIHEFAIDKPSIIFVHGITFHAGVYTSLIPTVNFLKSLAEKGFNVIALDIQGHGKSGGTRGFFTYHDLIGNISRAVDYTFQHYNQKIGIFGSSLGGILSFYAAIAEPRIKAAVCHNVLDLKNLHSSLPYLGYRRFLLPLVKTFPTFLRSLSWLSIPLSFFINPNQLFENPENSERWRNDSLCVWNYRASSWFSLFLTPDDKPAVEEMKKPIRIIVGEKDPFLPVESAKNFYKRLRCKKDLVIVPKAGHMLPLEHPSITVSLVTEWFNTTLTENN